MKLIIGLLLNLVFLISCSTTVVDPHSKKAVYNDTNRDIVWNQKVFDNRNIRFQYNASEMFTDNLETQNEIKKANEIHKQGNNFFWITWGTAVTYMLATKKEDRSGTIFYGLLATSLLGSAHYHSKANSEIKKSIKRYNKKMNYSLVSIYENQKHQRGLGFALLKSF